MIKIKTFTALIMIAVGCNLTTASAQNTSKTAMIPYKKDEPKKTNTIHLTKAMFLAKVANFETNPKEWKYLGDKPCIIDFYTTWCGPCKMIAPIMEELAKEYEGRLYIYKVDTEQEPEVAGAFGIRSIPTLIFCPLTEKPTMSQGARSKEDYKKAIDELLLKK